jgi:hypothetical protein
MDALSIPEPFAIDPNWHRRDNDVAYTLAWLKKGEAIEISDTAYEALCPPLQRRIVKVRRTGDAYTIRDLSYYVYRKA